MSEKDKAAENLEVIRSLMERATVYRTISGPTALFGGILALVMGLGGDSKLKHLLDIRWHYVWYLVLAVIVVFNTVLVFRKSQREKKPFWSPGLKAACRAIAPALLVGFIAGQILAEESLYMATAASWMCGYGLALMATGSFSPRSIWNLGLAFVVAGILVAIFPKTEMSLWDNGIMALTFGLFHLIYGGYIVFTEKDRS